MKKISAAIPTLSLMFLFVGAGCIGPSYKKPALPTPEAWRQEEIKAVPKDEVSLKSWWARLEDPKLDEFIAQAVDNNLDLKIASSRINEARAYRQIARSEWFPQIQGLGSATRNRTSESLIPANLPGVDRTRSIYELGLAASWELDFWGRIRRQSQAAAAKYDASKENYRDVMVLLLSDVTGTYIEIRTFQLRIKFAEDNIKAQEGTLALTKNRNKAGLAPLLDVRQAELNLAQTKSTLPALRSLQTKAIHRLSVLLGENPGQIDERLGEMSKLPAAPEEIIAIIPADLVRQRPDLRVAERNLASETARIGVEQAEIIPKFFLAGNFVTQSTSTSDLFDDKNRAYQYGANFSWNLFTGGRILNTVKAQEERTEQALHQYEQTLLRALEDVEDSVTAFVEEKKRKESLEDAVTAAQESVRLVKVLYKTGLTNFQNVLDMERSLFQQQDNMAQSQGLVVQNAVQIYRALGGGWE